MKVLFLGTPEFAVKSLIALLSSSHQVVGVVTQPDRSLKHGKVELSAVKKAAVDAGLPIYQPLKIRDEIETLKSLGADIAVTAAYGQILNSAFLGAFEKGVINVHASLLPKYRGASPIQSAIAAGEKKTGVTIMRTALGVDTGDILAAAETEIGETETYGTLTDRLAEIGARLLVKTLNCYDKIKPQKQNESEATHCRMISKSEQYIDFSANAQKIVNMIRSLSPSPCAKTLINGEIYKIYQAKPLIGFDRSGYVDGAVVESKNKLLIACKDGAVEIMHIQAQGKRALDISEFLRGRHFEIGVTCAKPQL